MHTGILNTVIGLVVLGLCNGHFEYVKWAGCLESL